MKARHAWSEGSWDFSNESELPNVPWIPEKNGKK